MSVFLTPDELARRWRLSRWQAYELTRTNRVPLVQLPGQRKILIPLADLERYEQGSVELELVETRNSAGCGRVVRPVGEEDGRRAGTRRAAVSTPAARSDR